MDRHLREEIHIHTYADLLHPAQDLDERHLDVPEQAGDLKLVQVLLQKLFQPQGDVRVLTGVRRGPVHRSFREADLLLSCADEIGDGDHLVVEISQTQRI